MSVDADRAASLAERQAALGDDQRAAMRERLQRAARFAGSNKIRPRNGVGPVPLSFAQQRLWFLDQLVPQNPFYNIPSRLPLGPVVDQRALERSIAEIVGRHESLRTTFAVVDGEPVQVVAPEVTVPLAVIDLRDAPPSEQHRLVHDEARREVRRPFDLSSGPLVRTTLVRTDDGNELLLTMHHIVSDGWSMGVFLRELMTVYGAFVQGRPSPLAQLPIQYPDFAVWQRQHLTGEVVERHISYWRQVLRQLPVLELPTDFARPAMPSFRGDNVPVRVSRDVTEGIRRLAAELGATPFMVLLAGFAALLHRATHQDSIAIGVPIANRTEPQLEPLIGFFVNSLALRIDVDGQAPARTLIHAAREVALGAYAHQDLPFERLVDELQPERDLSRNPLTQVTIQLQNAPTATGELPDDDVQLDPAPGTSIVDLALSLWETTGAFVGMVQYSTDLFERSTVEHLIEAYICLLDDLVARPDAAIDDLRLSAAEPNSNRPSAPAAPAATLDALVRREWGERRDRVAVRDGNATWTFGDIDTWSAAVADRLREHSIGPGDVVAVATPRSVEQVVGFLGVLRAGAAYLPIDPDLPDARRAAMFDDAAVRCALIRPGDARLPDDVTQLVVDGWDPGSTTRGETLRGVASPEPPVGHGPDDAAYVLFTSGSTGRPKGVRVSHRSIVNHMAWMQRRFPMNPDDAVLQRTPAHFDASVWEFWAPLMAGARLVLHQATHAADARALCDALEEHGITIAQFVPSLLRFVIDEPRFMRATSLRRLFCGGEPLPPALVREVRSRTEAELVNLYGPTEATIDATAWVCGPDDVRRARVPIGFPIDGMSADVVGADGRSVPVGTVGELHLSGVGVADGYVGRRDPDVAGRFDGVAPMRRYRTGDLARRRSDGALEVLGRLDDQLKIRGNRIEPVEIEQVLVDHDAVESAVVLAASAVEGLSDSLVAYIVPATDTHDDESARLDADGEGGESGRSDPSAVESAHVDRWHDLYTDVYRRPNPTQDDRFDIVGWDSSYDLSPIGVDDMRAWLDESVARIVELRPRRVLEIGAGTGLIALAVAPRCDHYLATDFSEEALKRLRTAGAGIDALDVQELRADELATTALGDYDLVILNSVVQYFPSERYLRDVLRAAAARLAPGGRVFVGDVRNLQLLSAFHLSIALPDADGSEPVKALHGEVGRRCHADTELVVDPRWFHDVDDLILEGIRPKATPYTNELTMFRYDVVLRGSPRPHPAGNRSAHDLETRPDVHVVEHRPAMSIDRIERELRDHDGPVVLSGVPNRRLAAWADADRLLRRHADDDVETFRTVVDERVAQRRGLDPDEALQLARRLGRDAETYITSATTDGSFDLVTWPMGAPPPTWGPMRDPAARTTGERWITSPLDTAREANLISELRSQAAARLPAALVPDQFVVVPALPLHPNGKLDRAALPRPDRVRPDSRFVSPDGELETVLAAVWSETLGQRRVGATDEFFADLGGHSLLATQLIARLRELFAPDLPLRLVFDAPTVAQMADQLAATVPDATAVASAYAHVRELTDEEVLASVAADSREEA